MLFPEHPFHIMMTSNEETPDEFATPREGEESSSNNGDTGTPARRTLVLHGSGGSGNSSLTGDSSTSTKNTRRVPTVLSDLIDDRVLSDASDGEDRVGVLTGDSEGPRYMSRCPPSNGLVVADVEEAEKEEGDGGDSDIEGEDGKEFEEAAVEAMEEKMQAATDDSNPVAAKPVSFHKFHDSLSQQMLQWDPAHQLYPGDNNMRRVKQLNKTQRVKKKRRSFESNGYEDTVSIDEFKRSKKGPNPRLCGNLSEFRCHANGIVKQGAGKRGKGALRCVVCNSKAYTSCGLCLTSDTVVGRHPPLCFFPSKGPAVGNSCFLDYHNDAFFGLAKKDCNSVVTKREAEWVAPNGAKRDEHAKYMTEFMESIECSI
jgi:hypothetical protein